MSICVIRARRALVAAGAAVTLAAGLATIPAVPAGATPGSPSIRYGPSSWLTNKASGLTAFVNAPTCHEHSCLNGSPIGLGTDRSTFQAAFQETGNSFEIRWWGDRCLDASAADNNARVLLQSCEGDSSQLWQKVDLGNGGVGLLNVQSGRCLDSPNGRFPNPPLPSEALQIFDCARSGQPWRVNQIWDFDT
ncbi:RICIN domain-containing protein [Streptomyces tubercidicus]|uniref:RICIN domain-containing protein n=1 Tax=Streptomyces tubercidicus TaxID=47759 RepID=UPI003467823C